MYCYALLSTYFFLKKPQMPTHDDDNEITRIIMAEDNSTDDDNTVEKKMDNEECDPEWSDNGENTVEDDSFESNSRRDVR